MNICISRYESIFIYTLYNILHIFILYTHTQCNYMCTSVHLDAKPCFYVHMYTRFVPIWIYVYIKLSEFYLFF